MYAFVVGLHSLSFWKSVNLLGTVPTAVSKGAQQGGVFIMSHIIYCHIDTHECMTWNYPKTTWIDDYGMRNVTHTHHFANGSFAYNTTDLEKVKIGDHRHEDVTLWSQMQKSVAMVMCIGGVMVYALYKAPLPDDDAEYDNDEYLLDKDED
jgi:hypothetical protein